MPDNQFSANQQLVPSDDDSVNIEAKPLEPVEAPPATQRQKLVRWPGRHKKLSALAVLVILIIILTAIPFSRYHLAGLALKQNYSVQIIDNDTRLPVSGASVRAGTQSAQTDANGRAHLRLPVGQQKFTLSKKYYQAKSATNLVPILAQKNTPGILLQATGRQVKLHIANLINKKALSNVAIATAGISAKTDQSGNALLVLPAGVSQQSATLSLDGYNAAKATINISAKEIKLNNLTMTPSGKTYFLAEHAGSLSIMKSDLDGASPQVVVAGTGNESVENTSLSHSDDWKYLALLAKRNSGPASLFVINTADDQLLTMDQGNETFSPIGWDGDNFIYTADRPKAIDGVYDQLTLKSYNAASGHLASIDQTNAQSINADTFIQSTIDNVHLLNKNLVYTKFWARFGYYAPPSVLTGKTNSIYKTAADGSGKQTLQNFNATDYQSAASNLRNPNDIYYQLNGFDKDGQRRPSVYWEYANAQLSLNKTLTQTMFNTSYPTYFLSPSGDHYFWDESSADSTSFFISDQLTGKNQRIVDLKNYNAVGWFSDDYLLLKSANQLYIMAASGAQPPIKIADFQPTAVY